MADSFHWLDIDRIAEGLADEHPDRDPAKVGFPDLRRLVTELEGFREQAGHPCNERILEAIQMAWLKERDEGPVDLDDDRDDPRASRPW